MGAHLCAVIAIPAQLAVAAFRATVAPPADAPAIPSSLGRDRDIGGDGA